ncbi:glycosyltransferase family 2 protein [Trueperella pyogenes]|uniref:glycosyltransferase family 2 protein n=1 Tax=Trueperella pyogenes TaxID=1661 RepID=UPI001013C870|nr:hypothetical protein [Trueperella pyogenes]
MDFIELKEKQSFFADSDLILVPGWHRPLIEALTLKTEDTREYGGMAASALIYPQTGGVQHAGVRFGSYWLRHWKLNADPSTLSPLKQSVQLAPFALFAITREVLVTVGNIDVSYRNGYEDFDFQMRARAEGFRTSLVTAHPSYHWEMRSGPARNENRKANLGRFISTWGSTLVDDASQELVEELKTCVCHGMQIVDVTRTTATSRYVLSRVMDELNEANIYRSSGIGSEPKEVFRETSKAYFVDNFVELLDHYYWLEKSPTIEDDWVVDQYGNSMPLKGIISQSWPGRRIR